MGSPHSSYCACTICNLKFVTLKRHTPDKFDQFLEDNIVTRKAICETLNDDNCREKTFSKGIKLHRKRIPGLYNATKTLAFASYFCKMRLKILY
jgi:hypothetical protein